MLPTDETPDQNAPALLGTVFRKTQGWYTVRLVGTELPCELSTTLRKQLIYPISAACKHPPTDPAGCPKCRPPGTQIHRRVREVADIRDQDPVAVGDQVQFIGRPDGSGLITAVLPRRSTLVRRAASAKPIKQVIAANIDQVLVVMAAAQPAPSWELMDRYLVAAERAELAAFIVITKLDLVEPQTIAGAVEEFRRIGYPVLLTSTTQGMGIEDLKAVLVGKCSVLAGKSGAGKTTLLNTVQPGLGARVGTVSDHGRQAGKGRHTTSHVEMFGLDIGGTIVDTPGMREFGLWDVSSQRQRQEHESTDLAEYFPELRPLLGTCRFGLDCRHRREPGCALRQAVDAGDISERRFRSYLRLQE